MELFGLTTTEAIILAQKYNRADNERNQQRIRAINKQIEEMKKHNQELLKSEKEKVSEMNREARQLEPFIILDVFDVWPNETISIRPSDIKVMNGKIKETKYPDYDSPAPWGGYYNKTSKEPYTEIQLWDGRKIKVKESIQDIQNKVNETIERIVNIQATIFAKIIKNQD